MHWVHVFDLLNSGSNLNTGSRIRIEKSE